MHGVYIVSKLTVYNITFTVQRSITAGLTRLMLSLTAHCKDDTGKNCNNTLCQDCALKFTLIVVHVITEICNSVRENVHAKVVRYVHAFRV